MRNLRQLRGQAKPGEQVVLTDLNLRVRQAKPNGQTGLYSHSDRDGLAVPQRIVSRRFQRVTYCVSIVEKDTILARIPLVASDYLCLQSHASRNDVEQNSLLKADKLVHVLVQLIE